MTGYRVQADGTVAAYTGTDHHPDCDGWRASHPTGVVTLWTTAGKPLFRPSCGECGPLGPGLFGDERAARDHASRHDGGMVPCDGRCLSWDKD